jgi:DNA-binding GntR family transcriptional regulator
MAYFNLNQSIHQHIVDAAGNPVLSRIYASECARIQRYRYCRQQQHERWGRAVQRTRGDPGRAAPPCRRDAARDPDAAPSQRLGRDAARCWNADGDRHRSAGEAARRRCTEALRPVQLRPRN